MFEYKQLLQKYYIFNRLPDSYFDLPPKKIQLPLTPQELTPSLREQFPFFPRDSEHFKTQITKLRTVYKFTRLPNDYLISKKRLPADPSNLTCVKHITFPITDTNTYLDFLQNIPRYYAISEPLLEAYINFNYTDKPELPLDSKLVEKVNLTLPISTPRELVIAARALRTHYFFRFIPKEWIDIPPKIVDPDNNVFPETVEQLNEQIQLRDLQSKWIFPLDKQEEFPEAVDFLRRNFLVDTIPEFVFNITSFPPPCWDLFNEHQDMDTHMQITIPQSSLDGLETELTTYLNEQS